SHILLSYFFFQAEDGIRYLIVTGVQTCALPIYPPAREPSPRVGTARSAGRPAPARACCGRPAAKRGHRLRGTAPRGAGSRTRSRSEERRVGKEWRSRGVMSRGK